MRDRGTADIVIAYRIRKARRKARELGLTKVQTERLVEQWKRQGAK